MTDEDYRNLLSQHCTTLEALNKKQNSIVADIRNERKRAKSSGFSKGEIDFALQLRASQDHTADVAEYKRLAQIALWVGHPIGTQPDMFAIAKDADALIDKASRDGEQAGAEGESAKSPHPPGSPQDQAWMGGWHKGQSSLASTLGRGDQPEAQHTTQ